MLAQPTLPLDTSAQSLVDFCLYFRTTAGFIAQFEKKLTELGGQRKHMGAAYEATEQLYGGLFSGQRRFQDRETFYNARSRHNREL